MSCVRGFCARVLARVGEIGAVDVIPLIFKIDHSDGVPLLIFGAVEVLNCARNAHFFAEFCKDARVAKADNVFAVTFDN